MAEAQGQAETQPVLEVMNANQAVEHLSNFIQEEEKKIETPRDEKGKYTKPEVKTEEAKPETEATEEKAEETESEEEQIEIQPEPRRFKLKYKGEEMEKDETEVISLAQQGFDYTQKSQALAKEREEIQGRLKSEVEAKQNAYLQQLEVHKTALSKIAGVKTMAEIEQLARTDPATAQQEFLRAISINQTVAQIEAEQAKIHNQRQTEAQESVQKQAREAVERLQERIPGWNQDLYGKILKGAVDGYGFKQQEVNNITDHRAIEVLNDALKWREYQSAKPKTVDKRVAAVPKVTKPGTSEKSAPIDKVKAGMDRLSKSGSRDDAVSVVEEMIRLGKI